MKTLTITITAIVLLLNICMANEKSYKLTISNLNFTSERSLEFDVNMLNTGKSELRYLLGQYFLEFNPGIANGGSLKYSVVSSGLPQEFIPRNPSVSENILRLACNSLNVNKEDLPVISSDINGTLIVRMKLETTADKFSNESVNLKWTDKESKFRSKVFTFFNNENIEITNENFHENDLLLNGNSKVISSSIPETFSMSQNYPNPFNPSTKIKFAIPVSASNVKLTVYDITGREVSVLVNEVLQPGTYEVSFSGSTFSSGVYFYRINAGQYSETMRMLLIK